MKHIYLFWHRLKSDWRNMALFFAGLMIVILLLPWVAGGTKPSGTPLVKVGNYVITERDVVKGLKEKEGDAYLTSLIHEALIASYAATQGISVSAREIEQVIAHEALLAELQGNSLEEMMKQQGVTMQELRRRVRVRLLQVKLLVPEEKLAQAVESAAQQGALPFTIPARYEFRALVYNSQEEAKKAVAVLNAQGGDKLQEALAMAVNGKAMETPRTVVPALLPEESREQFFDAIKGLKDGQAGAPKAMGMEGPRDMYQVMQLVKVIPEEKPTMENRGMYIGSSLLEEEEYRLKEREMMADALNKIDIYPFKMTDYTGAKEYITNLRLDNPQIPSLSPEELAVPSVAPPAEEAPVPDTAPVEIRPPDDQDE